MRPTRHRLAAVAGVTAAAVVGFGAPAVAAAPNVASSPAVERLQLQRPTISVIVSDPDGGSLNARFFARKQGSSTWDLVNATLVSVTSGGRARLQLPTSLPIGQVFEWQGQACDTGTCSASTALQTSTVSQMIGAGIRPNATRLTFPVADRVTARVDVGSGNLLVTSNDVSLPGVKADVPVGLAYNSAAVAAAGVTSTASQVGYGWTFRTGLGVKVIEAPAANSAVTYYGPDGLTALFAPLSGSTTVYTASPGVKADLAKLAAGGWTLTDRLSGAKSTFDASGLLTSIADRDANTTTYSYSSGTPTSIVSSRGPTAARTVTVNSGGGRVTGLTQTNGSVSRSIVYTVDANSDLTKIKDPLNRETSFAYTGHDLTQVTSPSGAMTSFTYDGEHRVTSISQANTASGSPGTSVTRLAYPTRTQTLLAGPNTDQSAGVSSVPRTTYNLSVDGRASSVTDAAGRARSRTYTSAFDTLTDTQDTGAAAATTTNTYGANGGESITASQAPTGAKDTLAYANTAAATKYQPSSGTDSDGNQSLFTYSGTGNKLTSTDASAAQAKVTYNTDGTVATATSPANGTNSTGYGYDADHQLTSITPPTGTTLGERAFTYDEYGRSKTSTNGRGVTTTYTYDALDRVTSTTFSGGSVSTPAVAYTYDPAGRVATRTDSSGTTTYGYDDLSRLTSRSSTAGGGTIGYGYDKASNLKSTTDTRGTTTYDFDDAGVPTGMNYQYDGATRLLQFAVDSKSRRTDTWLQSNATHTTWVAHSHTDYTSSGRVARVWADQGTGDASNTRVADLNYCYATGSGNTSLSPTCSTTTTNDRSKIQWVKDAVAGEVVYYTYDTSGRLKTAKTVASSTTQTYTYTYDANGNRKTASDGTTTTSVATNAANQITTTGYTYDGAGNLTAHPTAGVQTYNGADQMTKVVKSGSTYDYNYAGANQNEVTRQAGPTTTYDLVYGRTDPNGLPVIEQASRSGSAGNNGTAYIEHDPVTGEPLLLRTSSGMQSLYLFDANRNPIALITSGAYVALAQKFDPYGLATVTTNSGGLGAYQNPYTFAQGVQDRATGWIKYGQRWYDPTDGRFTQQDTLDAPLNPSNANRYAYAADDPINNTDPTGRLFSAKFNCIVAIVSLVGAEIALVASLFASGGATAPLVFFGLSGLGILGSCYDENGNPIV